MIEAASNLIASFSLSVSLSLSGCVGVCVVKAVIDRCTRQCYRTICFSLHLKWSDSKQPIVFSQQCYLKALEIPCRFFSFFFLQHEKSTSTFLSEVQSISFNRKLTTFDWFNLIYIWNRHNRRMKSNMKTIEILRSLLNTLSKFKVPIESFVWNVKFISMLWTIAISDSLRCCDIW